jgi:hypothetical protein
MIHEIASSTLKSLQIRNCMPTKRKTEGPSLTLHAQVSGKVAEWIIQMKEDGLVTSYTDAVLQGLILLRSKFKSMGSTESSPTAGDVPPN